MDFADAVTDHLSAPSNETLATLRSHIVSASNFDAYLDTPLTLDAPGVSKERAAEIESLMPGAFLSPRAHAMLATIYSSLGDEDAAEREKTLASFAVAGILNTGDGSEEQPWSVLRVSDEYDVLIALGARSTHQETSTHNGRVRDTHRTNDGRTLWFELFAGNNDE